MALSDVALINPRGIVPSPGTLISFVPMADLDATNASTGSGTDRHFSEVQKGYTVFQHRDILVAKITPCFENGKIGQAELAHDIGVGSTEFHVVRPDPAQLDDRYLLHFLRQRRVRVEGEQRMTGSAGQKRVPAAFLSQLKIPLPSLPEQRRIAAILDQADALQAKRRQTIALLDDLVQSIFLDMFGDPVNWAALWPMGRIRDLAASVDYGTSSRAGSQGAWPVLRMGNLTTKGHLDLSDLKFMDLTEREVQRYTVRLGDVLFNRTNSPELVGKTAVVRSRLPMAYAGYLIRVRMNAENDAEFLAAYLNSRHGKAVLRSMCKSIVGQANINAKELQGIPIALPPLPLQREFALRVAAVESVRVLLDGDSNEQDQLFMSLQGDVFSCDDSGYETVTTSVARQM